MSAAMEAVAGTTRDKLLDTATRLLAERGVFDASLAEIVREAGQRNVSAVHYHFGSRDQLLLAVLEPQVEVLRRRRVELLSLAGAAPAGDLRPLAEVIVRPLVELAQQGWRERAWMKIGMELADHFDRVPAEIRSLLDSAGGTEAMGLLEARCPPLPAGVWELRQSLCIGMVSRAARDRAVLLDEVASGATAAAPSLDEEAFVANLVAMFLGALTVPWPVAAPS